jgi:hypothetical protein
LARPNAPAYNLAPPSFCIRAYTGRPRAVYFLTAAVTASSIPP